jgi:hypothetical protein
LNDRERQAQRAAAYKDCRERIYTSPLEACVLYSDATGTAKPPKSEYPGGPDTEPGRWFDTISSSVRMSRERYACTQLGIIPGTSSFGGCVRSLKEAVIPNRG